MEVFKNFKKVLGYFFIFNLSIVYLPNDVFAIKDPHISQEEVVQISREINRVLSLLPSEKKEEIKETVGVINFELAKRIGTKELVDKICELAEFTVRYLAPIAGQKVADKAVESLGKCFYNVIKARALRNYPRDIIKLQNIGIDFRKFMPDGGVRLDSSIPIATDSSFSDPLESYIPGMHLMIGDNECLVGFNDFAVPIMKTLQRQLIYDLSCFDSCESVKRLYKDQLEEKSKKALPCGEGFELEGKKLEEITDMHHDRWEYYVPIWQFKVIYDVIQVNKKVDKELDDFKDIVMQANFSATTIAHLRYYIDKFGENIVSGKPLCLFVLDKKMGSGMYVAELPPSNQFNMIESTCRRIMDGDMTSQKKIVALHEGLSSLEKILKPHTGDQIAKLSFSFAINRVSHYLETLENYRQGKTLEEILAMRSLRLALNRYAIEYKFMFASQVAPILGIRINRCKIIMDNESYIVIFLEKMDAEAFEEKIANALDNKAQNIVQKYPDMPFSREKIREIAESLDPSSYKDIIEKLKRKENALTADIERKRIEAEEHFLKSYFGKVKLVCDSIVYVASGLEWTIDKVESFMKSKTNDSGFPGSNIGSEYMEEFKKGCQSIIDANGILENRKIISMQRSYWEKVHWYEQDFINLLKLNIQLKRAKLEEADYDGIIIEEKKSVYDNGLTDARLAKFNEYTVEKIDELEEKD